MIFTHIEFLVRRVAQPVADFLHDHFGVTCYRLAVQLPIMACAIELFHAWINHAMIDWTLALLIVVWLRRAWLFHRLDLDAARRDYSVKPPEVMGAPIHAFSWEMMFAVDAALAPIPPSLWSDWLSALSVLCLVAAWLLVMCDVKPRKRVTKRSVNLAFKPVGAL